MKTKLLFVVLSIFFQVSVSAQEESVLAATPPMGWISWGLFKGNISEDIVKELADAMVESGLKDAGYEYVILDDLWHGRRDKDGNVYPDPRKFPNGIKVVADYVHSKGLM